jgi:MFS family permease
MKTITSPSETQSSKAPTLTLALSMLLASLGTSIANIALPAMMDAFSVSFTEVQAVVVAYLSALTVTVTIAGRLGDRIGLKPALITGLGLFFVASLLCALAPTLWLLVAARVFQGVGAAFLMTLSMALMRQTTRQDELGRAMGLLGTVSAVGTALGPSLGGLITPMIGWPGIFWVQLPLAAIAIALAATTLPEQPVEPVKTHSKLLSVLNARLIPGLTINTLVAAVMMTTLVVGPFYLSLGLGLTGEQAGFVMATGPVVAIVSGLPSGKLVDTLGSNRILSFGLIHLALGALALAFLPNVIGLAGYLLPIVVLTVGYQLFQSANNTAVLADVSPSHRGTVSGVLNLSRNLGLIMGASAMGLVFSIGAETADLGRATPAMIANGMRLTFTVAAGMITVAAAVHFLASHLSKESSP